MTRKPKPSAQVVVIAALDTNEQVAARLGIPLKQWWHEIDSGRIVMLAVRWPEPVGEQRRI